MPILTFKSTYPVPPEEVFRWHERLGAIERLSPPWIDTDIESWQGIGDGHRAVLKISKGPFSTKWVAVHDAFIRGKQFIDYQESGPFQYWKHVHRFEPFGEGHARLTDEIDFQVPGGSLGERLVGGFVRRDIERLFAYRHRILGQDILLHRQYNPSRVSLRIAITGSSGLIGTQLAAFFTSGGHRVTRIVRRPAGEREIYWNPAADEIDRNGLEGHDAIIHLAGEDVLHLKWDDDLKRRITESRIRGTRLMAEAITSLQDPPSVFMSASGIGVYGHHGNQSVSEASGLKPGGFLASVAREWEAAAQPVMQKGIRTVLLRFGAVLSPRGGMLRKVLPLFWSGLGGRFGGDVQWLSWITLDDVIGAINHAMMSTTAGPINLVTPKPVTTDEFARTLGSVLWRPSFVRYPRGLAEKVLGETAEELFFESHRTQPAYLSTAGYQFMHPELEGALRHVLGRVRTVKVGGEMIDLSSLRT